MTVVYLLLMFVLGSVMGSFVGAMTWRMRHHLDWVKGRSECEHCHHQLAVLDLIPIWSYLALRGKCQYCHRPIGRTALGLELATGAAFLISAMVWPSAMAGRWWPLDYTLTALTVVTSLALGLWLVCLTIMAALFIYDLRWRLLPNKLVFPLVGVSLLWSAVFYLGVAQTTIGDWLLNVGLGLLPIAGVYGLLYIVSRGRWIGFGDVKLGLAIGCLVPWWGGLVVLFLANFLGALAAVPGLLSRRLHKASQIAFGPYLIISTYLVVLFGWVLLPLIKLVL